MRKARTFSGGGLYTAGSVLSYSPIYVVVVTPPACAPLIELQCGSSAGPSSGRRDGDFHAPLARISLAWGVFSADTVECQSAPTGPRIGAD